MSIAYNKKLSAVAVSNLQPLWSKSLVMGRVHSKFASGFNVELNGQLVYINAVQAPLAPWGIQLEPEALRELLTAVEQGSLVKYQEDSWLFYTQSGAVRLELSKARQAELKVPQPACGIAQIRRTMLFKYLNRTEAMAGAGLSKDRQTQAQVRNLSCLKLTDRQAMRRSIEFFTGRGPGLTPSGDDVLYGFSLVLVAFGKGSDWLAAMREMSLSKATTDISLSYLRALLQGYASSVMCDLVRALDMREQELIERIVATAAAFGHTSGRDILQGFCCALHCLSGAETTEG